jgi:hypothetical protein
VAALITCQGVPGSEFPKTHCDMDTYRPWSQSKGSGGGVGCVDSFEGRAQDYRDDHELKEWTIVWDKIPWALGMAAALGFLSVLCFSFNPSPSCSPVGETSGEGFTPPAQLWDHWPFGIQGASERAPPAAAAHRYPWF